MTSLSLKAVLFDLDGTLIDSAPDLGHAANLVRQAQGLAPLPLGAYRQMAGAGARGCLKVALGIDPDHPDYDTYKHAFLEHYGQCMTERTYAFEGVPELLAGLQARGLPWGVVTNKVERFALPLAAGMPLFASCSTVVGGDTTGHAKPHPAPLLVACERMGVAPEDCIYVGDDHRDVVAGKAAGMPTVACTYGYLGAVSVEQWKADTIVHEPLALLTWIDQVFCTQSA